MIKRSRDCATHGFERVRAGSSGFARVRAGSSGFERVRAGSRGFARVRAPEVWAHTQRFNQGMARMPSLPERVGVDEKRLERPQESARQSSTNEQSPDTTVGA